MDYMFALCRFETLDLSSFDTHKVRTMQGMFSSAYIDALNMSSFDTRNVEVMSKMFNNSRIHFIDMESFHFNGLSNIASHMPMFENCRAKHINIPHFEKYTTKKEYEYSSTFANCDATLMLPHGVTMRLGGR